MAWSGKVRLGENGSFPAVHTGSTRSATVLRSVQLQHPNSVLGAQSSEFGVPVQRLEIAIGAGLEFGNRMRKCRERAIPLFDELISFYAVYRQSSSPFLSNKKGRSLRRHLQDRPLIVARGITLPLVPDSALLNNSR
jgi:hypothetical protein